MDTVFRPHEVRSLRDIPDAADVSPDSASCFDKAYQSTAYLRFLIPPESFEKAKAELTKILTKYPRVRTLAEAVDETPDSISVAKALLLLYARADGHTRKFNPEPAYEHSIRVTEDYLIVVDGCFKNKGALIRSVVKLLLHDIVEDFKTTLDEIRKAFRRGSGIATGIDRMTTPGPEDLAKAYPALATIPMLRELKKKFSQGYEVLKAQLKLHYKCEKAKIFPLDELVGKGVDNSDSIFSYLRDVRYGRVVLRISTKLGTPKRLRSNGPFYLSTAEAARNIRDRTNYHENAVEARLDVLRQQAKDHADTALVSAEDIDIIKARLHKLFWDRRDDFAALVEGVNPRPLLEQMQEAGEYWAERIAKRTSAAAGYGRRAFSSMLAL